jgi:hypothetical protein
MEEQKIHLPTRTVWKVELTHGVVVTDAGAIGGWGWVCTEHEIPLGIHGFPTPATALDALSVHMAGCGDSG